MEALFRRGLDWYTWWPVLLLPALLMNYAIWRVVNSGPTLVMAIAGFNLATLAVRCGVSQWIVHEPVTKGNAAAVAVLVVGLAASIWWK